jgi:hypothetical protein
MCIYTLEQFMKILIAVLLLAVSSSAAVITGQYNCGSGSTPYACNSYIRDGWTSASPDFQLTAAGGSLQIYLSANAVAKHPTPTAPYDLAYVSASAGFTVASLFSTDGPIRPGYLSVTSTCVSVFDGPVVYGCQSPTIDGSSAIGFVPITLGTTIGFTDYAFAQEADWTLGFAGNFINTNTHLTLQAFESNGATPVGLTVLADQVATPEPAPSMLMVVGAGTFFLVFKRLRAGAAACQR